MSETDIQVIDDMLAVLRKRDRHANGGQLKILVEGDGIGYCVWGLAIEAGHARKHGSYGRGLGLSLRRALTKAGISLWKDHLKGEARTASNLAIGHINDAIMYPVWNVDQSVQTLDRRDVSGAEALKINDKNMRKWLRTARTLLEKGTE